MADKKKKATKDMSESELKELLKECQLSLSPRMKLLAEQIEGSKTDIDKKSDVIDTVLHKFDSVKDSMILYRELRQAQRDLLAEEKALEFITKAYNCETYEEFTELSRDLIYALSEIRGVIADEETIEMDKAKDFQYMQGFYDGISAGYKYLNNKFFEPK